MHRRSSNRLVEIAVVQEHRSKVSDQIDHEELRSSLRPHGQVAPACIALERTLGRQVSENLPQSAGRANDIVRRVGGEGEGEDDDQEDQGVDVVRDESRLDATVEGVDDHTDGEEEHRRGGWRSCEELDHSGAAGEQHGRDEDVGEAAEHDEDSVRYRSVSRPDDFKECMSVGSPSLQLDG